MKRFITLITLAAIPLAANDAPPSNLEEYIPYTVQQQYGLTQLSQEQRNQIASWLKEKKVEIPQSRTSYLSLNIASGSYIQLQDGTVWEIKPSDRIQSQGWLSTVKIEISSSGDKDYPYRLYNIDSRTAVSAKKVSMKTIENL